MDQFPAFSDPLGYLLLEQDFETLHPECNLKLYVAWPKLSDFICNKISSKAKSRLNHVFTPDGIKVATFSLMPHLFPVITIRKGLLFGDNLGIHAMCGFIQSFRANYACRFCKLHRAISETICLENESVLRTRTSYAIDLALDNSSITGIKEECVFNAVNSFHVIDNAYVDIMHDVLEDLNYSVQMFDYGPTAQNKPPYTANDFATKTKLKMTASE
ncbi:hypothetical protein RF55_13884, partial [Lasius niger]